MSSEQKQFIGRLSKALGRDRLPDAPTHFQLPHDVHHHYLQDASLEELKQTFIKNCEAVGTLVFQCSEREALNTTITQAIDHFDGGSICIADHDYFNNAGTFKQLCNQYDQVDRWDINLSREENIHCAEQANIGITKAELALAESGTVVLYCHLGSGRSVSLLPTYTITVIEEKDMRPRLTQAMSFLRKEKQLPCSVNFVSGASATADIELVRVQGVHGPLAIAYILVA